MMSVCVLRTLAAALGAALALLGPAPANATWLRVESDKFVVYGEGSEKSVRDFATKLATYDSVLRRFHPSTVGRTPATKVQVVLVSSNGVLRHVQPRLGKYILGFYTAMNEGIFAFAVKDGGLEADDVLFHEYAHHFMYENFPAAYPAWFVEGWAEYFMTTEITPTTIKVGGYNPARVYSIFTENWLPLEQVLSKTTAETGPSRGDVYYSEAWLLTHYMRSDERRAKQLDAAIIAISKGEEPVKAMQSATGLSMAELTRALKKYEKLQIYNMKNPGLAPEMTVTALPKSADDLLLDNMRVILWPTGQADPDSLADIRRKAAKYPGDTYAERVLARAEFVMGDVAAGEAIMKRRLAASPDDVEDLLLAGTGQLMAGYRDTDQREARYRAARPLLAKAYKLDDGDFRVLYAYGLSRTIEPGFPTDNDLNVLLEARRLAPAVQENAMRAGVALLQKGRRDDAMKVLAPVINNPHGGRFAGQAKALLNQGQIGVVDLDAPEDDEDGAPPPAPAKPAK